MRRPKPPRNRPKSFEAPDAAATQLPQEMRPFQAAFGPVPEGPGARPAGASAVLVPFVSLQKEPALLFTVRSQALAQHAGEISFPGGRLEAADLDPLRGALREAEEEIGVRPDRALVLGHLAEYQTFRGQLVNAFGAWLPPDGFPRQRSLNREVESILLVPIAQLRDAGARPKTRADSTGPIPSPIAGAEVCTVASYELRAFEVPPQTARRIHYWRFSNGRTLWGITGDLVALLLDRAFAWKPPVTPRLVLRPDDLRP